MKINLPIHLSLYLYIFFSLIHVEEVKISKSIFLFHFLRYMIVLVITDGQQHDKHLMFTSVDRLNKNNISCAINVSNSRHLMNRKG